MPTLFVALDLPATAKAELVRIQPANVAGIRLTAASQMHLTLHFIGEGEIERVAGALATIRMPAFGQNFEGVGQFPTAGGTTTLWAGAPADPELLELHAAVARSLAGPEFREEGRPYRPHLTLARCEPGTPPSIIEEFLRVHADFKLPGVRMESFGLFSSTLVSGIPVYNCERTIELGNQERPHGRKETHRQEDADQAEGRDDGPGQRREDGGRRQAGL